MAKARFYWNVRRLMLVRDDLTISVDHSSVQVLNPKNQRRLRRAKEHVEKAIEILNRIN